MQPGKTSSAPGWSNGSAGAIQIQLGRQQETEDSKKQDRKIERRRARYKYSWARNSAGIGRVSKCSRARHQVRRVGQTGRRARYKYSWDDSRKQKTARSRTER